MTKKIDVLVLREIQPKQMAFLEREYNLHRYDLADSPAKESLLKEFSPRIKAVITTHGAGFSEDLLQKLPALEIVACCSVGIETICLDACLKRSVTVTNTPDVLTDDVADMALMLLLATVRRLQPASQWIASGNWQKDPLPLNTSVTGKRIGIVGLGRIGSAIALRAKAFGMKISYYNRQPKINNSYDYYNSILSLAQNVDILMPTIPGGYETDKIISKAILEAIGSAGYFINIARGSVVDEEALIELLTEGRLAGAGLDVYEDEPNVPKQLIAMNNVVLQPHCASGTIETRSAMAQLVVDNLAAHFAGTKLLTEVK